MFCAKIDLPLWWLFKYGIHRYLVLFAAILSICVCISGTIAVPDPVFRMTQESLAPADSFGAGSMIVSHLLILMHLRVKYHRVLIALEMGACVLYIRSMTVLFSFVLYRPAVTSRKAVKLLYHRKQQPCLLSGKILPQRPLHHFTGS